MLKKSVMLLGSVCLFMMMGCEKEDLDLSSEFKPSQYENVDLSKGNSHNQSNGPSNRGFKKPNAAKRAHLIQELWNVLRDEGIQNLKSRFGNIRWMESYIEGDESYNMVTVPMIKRKSVKGLLLFYQTYGEYRIYLFSDEDLLSIILDNDIETTANKHFNAIAKYNKYLRNLTNEDSKIYDEWISLVLDLYGRNTPGAPRCCVSRDIWYEYVEYDDNGDPTALVSGSYEVNDCTACDGGGGTIEDYDFTEDNDTSTGSGNEGNGDDGTLNDFEDVRSRICASSVLPVSLSDPEVDAWYFKMLDFSYIFHYTDPTDSRTNKIFNVGFGDLCVNAYNRVIIQEGAAKIAFANAFELSVDQTLSNLNSQPWDDLLMNLGGEMAMYPYISNLFRTYLEENLGSFFGGNPNASTSPCSGVQGFSPVFSEGC